MTPGLVQPTTTSMPMPFQPRMGNSAYLATPAPRPPTAPTITGHAVEILGLPENLMSQKMMEVILDQAGLDNTAIHFQFFNPDKAEISFKNPQSAEVCVTHFHGCKWNPRGSEVKAWRKEADVSAPPLHPTLRLPKNKGQGPVTAPLLDMTGRKLPWVPADSPAYLHAGKKRCGGASEASTTVSDEDPEEIQWVPGEIRCF